MGNNSVEGIGGPSSVEAVVDIFATD